jgi:hypothetical protein
LRELARIERSAVRAGESAKPRKARDDIFFGRRNVTRLSHVGRLFCMTAHLLSSGAHRRGTCISPDIYRRGAVQNDVGSEPRHRHWGPGVEMAALAAFSLYLQRARGAPVCAASHCVRGFPPRAEMH